MLDEYKELTPVIYGQNAIKHLINNKKTKGMASKIKWVYLFVNLKLF